MWSDLLEWAYDRHSNVLSWYIRPLFILPFVYFAWRRSWPGIVITMVALLSSMVWFPAPEEVDPHVREFLAMEERIFRDPTMLDLVTGLAVPVSLTLLAMAFWRRSLGWGLVMVNMIAILKIAWSVAAGGSSGWAVLIPAVVGLAVCDLAIVLAARRFGLPITLRRQQRV